MRIEKIRESYDVVIKFVHFPLHPDTPAQGKTLEALFNCGADEVAQKNQHMKSLMDAEGLPYGQRTHTYNSRKAQELACWAASQPSSTGIHDALFRAYFVQGKNLDDITVLQAVCREVGLDENAAKEAVESGAFKAAVDDDWNLSRQYGVTGVPTYVLGQKGIVGAQPYEAIESLLLDSDVSKKPV